MKYMLLFISKTDATDIPEQARSQMYSEIGQWWHKHSASRKLVGGEQLQPVTTATTVSFNGEGSVVTDGPFMESKEAVGGFGILDVADLDEAIAIARTWPARGRVEIRPIVSQD